MAVKYGIELVEQLIKGGTKLSAEAVETLMKDHGDDLAKALNSKSPESFSRIAGSMGDSPAAGIVNKLGSNVDGLKAVETAMRSGQEVTPELLGRLGLNVSDEAAENIAKNLARASQEAAETSAGRSRTGEMLGNLRDRLARPFENFSAKRAANAEARAADDLEKGLQASADEFAAARGGTTADDVANAGVKTGDDAIKEGAKADAKKPRSWKGTAATVLTAGAIGLGLNGMDGEATDPNEVGLGTDNTDGNNPGVPSAGNSTVNTGQNLTDGKVTVSGKELDVSQIPLHLMTDAEVSEFLATHAGQIDPNDIAQRRQNALIKYDFAEIDDKGLLQADKEKWKAAREKFEKGIGDGKDIKEAARLALISDDAPKSGINGMFESIQDMFKEIVGMIQGFMKTLGAGGGLFGNSQSGLFNNQPAQQGAATNTPQRSPTQAPAPQQPSLTPEQVAENALLQEHRGYAQGTHAAISAGSMGYAAMDTSQVKWEKDEIITGNADIERIYQENIDGKFDGGTKGVLHMDEDEGLLYINKDANGDVAAYRVNDHINDISNLDDLAWSQSSLDGFGNMMMANDRHTANFNAQGGIVKTVEFDDDFFDGKDIKNEQLQFHARLDSQGRYSVSVVNDDYKQNNGAALTSAEGQTNAEIAKEDPGFDYYVAGKDPIQERLYNEQQSQARNQEIGDAVGGGIRNAGKMIEGMINNGMTVNIGNDNPTVSMGNRGPAFSATSAYDKMEQDARTQNRINGIDIN